MKTAGEALKETTAAIRDAAQEEAPQQARLLVAHVLGIEPGVLPLYQGAAITNEQTEALQALVRRRQERVPLQYLLGEWYFMGLPFRVTPGVLIPRQDTEVLCETALRFASLWGYRTALDLCCGTGCVGIALQVLGGLAVTASDCADECVALTRENAERHNADIQVLQGNWFAPHAGQSFDMIVCNPPYLTGEEMRHLQPEVAHEPALALYGGEDGLSAYRTIAAQAGAYLRRGGMLLLEVGSEQADDVCALFAGEKEVFCDLAGVRRVVCVQT